MEAVAAHERGAKYHEFFATVVDIFRSDQSLRKPSTVRRLGATAAALLAVGIGAITQVSDNTEATGIVAECSALDCPAISVTVPNELVAGERRQLEAAVSETTIPATVPPTQENAPTPALAVSKQPENKIIFRAQKLETLNHLDRYIKLIPRLDSLTAQSKISPEAAAEQKAHIENLHKETVVTLAEYREFEKSQVDNDSYANVFSGHPYFNHRIRATKIVIHWGGNHYVDVPDMANKMMSAKSADGTPDRRNTQFIIDSKKLFRTTPKDRIFKGAHAPGANEDSIGIEHNRITKMTDVQPADAKMTAMSVVYIARQHKIAINENNIWTHYGVDLMFNNSDYDRETGTINGNLRKFDYPQDYLLDVIIPLAKAIDGGLGPR